MYNSVSNSSSDSPLAGFEQLLETEIEDQLIRQQLAQFQQSMNAESGLSGLSDASDADDADDADDSDDADDAGVTSSLGQSNSLMNQLQNLEQFQLRLQNQGNTSNNGVNRQLNQLMQAEQLLQVLGMVAESEAQLAAQESSPTTTTPQGIDAKSFDIKSWGDPHIASTVNGNATSQTDMNNIDDLVDTGSSIKGGYKISTTTSTPEANGVTYNKSTTIELANGAKVVDTYNAANNTQAVTFTKGNVTQTLGAGSNVNLTNGSIKVNSDGSLDIKANGPNAASVQTVVTTNGKGLDVDTSGSNVYLSGYGADEQKPQKSTSTVA